ncbi:H(+)-transporting V1 sector ATPase subunit F [Nowakowskiella sp. JEL0407]|nr:H(+)-transporting V1 sector ATPase subunit F [Nowakowskiella sp. JEL0407]
MATGTKERNLIAVIGDEDSVTGLLLGGIGHIDSKQKPNFLVVDAKTPLDKIEESFSEFVKRKDIAIILITQQVADMIRTMIDDHDQAFPTVLEIPSKDHPYDPSKVCPSNFYFVGFRQVIRFDTLYLQDSVLKRVQRLFGDS